MSLKGDLGVYLIAYELMRRGWKVAINQGRLYPSEKGIREIQGYDILAEKNNITKKIEVKFIDSLFRSGSYKESLRQRVTHNEFEECEYVIVLIYHENGHSFYIIPKEKLEEFSYRGPGGYTLPFYYKKGSISKAKIERFKVKPSDDWNKLLGLK